VHQDGAGLVQDTDIHAAGMQIDAARRVVLSTDALQPCIFIGVTWEQPRHL
jgi:hypothetical protein